MKNGTMKQKKATRHRDAFIKYNEAVKWMLMRKRQVFVDMKHCA